MKYESPAVQAARVKCTHRQKLIATAALAVILGGISLFLVYTWIYPPS